MSDWEPDNKWIEDMVTRHLVVRGFEELFESLPDTSYVKRALSPELFIPNHDELIAYIDELAEYQDIFQFCAEDQRKGVLVHILFKFGPPLRVGIKNHADYLYALERLCPAYVDGEIELITKFKDISMPIKFYCHRCQETHSADPDAVIWFESYHQRVFGQALKRKEECAALIDAINNGAATDPKGRYVFVGKVNDEDETVERHCLWCGRNWVCDIDRIVSYDIGCPACFWRKTTSWMEQYLYQACVIAFGAQYVVDCAGDLRMNLSTVLCGETISLRQGDVDIAILSEKMAIEPGSWKYHSNRLGEDVRKAIEAHEKGLRLITIYDSFPDGMQLVMPNCFDVHTFPCDLGSEQGHLSLRNLIKELFGYELSDEEHKCCERFADIVTDGMSEERFFSDLKKKNGAYANGDFEVIGKFVARSVPIRCKCNICSNEWEVKPARLLSGSKCPRSQWHKKVDQNQMTLF